MHSFVQHRKVDGGDSSSQERGIVTLSAWFYDLIVRWFVMHGREQAFRQMVAALAGLQAGEAVLDVGCGTGTQALVAKKHVGVSGRVCGIDPSTTLIAGARHKATRRGLSIDFQLAGIEHLPFPNQSFDVVLSTFAIHHIPRDLKLQGFSEITRVLKPGGRLLVIDFKREEHQHTHGSEEMGIQDLSPLLVETGFSQIESGEIPFYIRSFDAGHQHYGFVRAQTGPRD